jgi:hypothetical protein
VRRLVCLSVTIATLLIISNSGRAQTFAPSNLALVGGEQETKKDPIQVITRETPDVITKEAPPQVVTKEKPAVAAKQMPEAPRRKERSNQYVRLRRKNRRSPSSKCRK